MTRLLRSGAEHLALITEALAWFIVIRVMVSTMDHAALTGLADDLERGAFVDRNAPEVIAAARIARDALDGLASGPSLLIVIVTAYAATLLARGVTRQRLGRGGATVIGLLGSVVALNVLLHVTLTGDLLIWDNSGIVDFFDPPAVREAARTQVQAFVADPSIARETRAGLAFTIIGMVLLWVRFLYVGRGRAGWDQVLRSFTIAFPLVLFAVLTSRISDVQAAIFALPYFVLALVTLAVANAARSSERAEGDEALALTAPWAVSMVATLGVIAGVASLFAMFALLEVADVLAPVGGLVLDAVSRVLVVVLTPLVWLADKIIDLILSDDAERFAGGADSIGALAEEASEEDESTRQLPSWVNTTLKLIGVSVLAVGSYYLAKLLFFRGGDEVDEEYAEERERTDGSGGLGALLGRLIPRPGRPGPRAQPWADRHSIYRLFTRMEDQSEERSFGRRPGETPIEFGAVAGRALDASAFPPIVEAFDRARYGRHYPTDEELRPLGDALDEWERAHPATDELRAEVARDAPAEEESPPPQDPPEPPEWPEDDRPRPVL